MATFQSNILSATPVSPSLPTDRGGRVRCDRATYTTLGTEVATDVIEMTKLPLDARVLRVVAFVPQLDATSDGGTTPTDLDLGDKDDDNRYATAISPDSAAQVSIYGDAAGQGSVLVDTENKRTIQFTVDASDIPAAAVLEVQVFYTID